MILTACSLRGQAFSIQISMDSSLQNYRYAVLSFQQGFGLVVRDTARLGTDGARFTGLLEEPVLATLKLYRDSTYTNPWFCIFGFYDDSVSLHCSPGRRILVQGSATQEAILTHSENVRVNEALRKTGAGVSLRTLEDVFITSHPASPYSLLLFKKYAQQIRDDSLLAARFKQLSTSLRQGPTGRWVEQQRLLLKQQDRGQRAPDFSLPDAQGRMVSLSDFRGKYVLLEFWSTTCRPCLEEIPQLAILKLALKDRNFEIVSVSLDTKAYKSNWLRMIDTRKMHWVHLGDGKGFANKAAVLYGIKGIPQNFLLDPNGTILSTNLSGKAMKDIIVGVVEASAKRQ